MEELPGYIPSPTRVVMTLSIYFSLSSGAIWKGGRDVDGIDDRGDKGTVTALQRGDELDIGAAGAAAEAQGFELFAVLAVGTAEAEGGEGRLQDHAVQLVAVVDGILHGDTAAHRPAEDDELIPPSASTSSCMSSEKSLMPRWRPREGRRCRQSSAGRALPCRTYLPGAP